VDELARRAWQDEGFFQVQVHSRATVRRQQPSPANERVAVSLHVDEGKQYRLSKITFKNNCGISNTEALRNIFSIKDGEVFKRSVIAEGLEKLRFVYREFGYVDATSFPDTLINDKAGTISLMVDIDEGMPFYVTDIHVLGPCSEIALGSRREEWNARDHFRSSKVRAGCRALRNSPARACGCADSNPNRGF
jgi:outer membrane protein insertion porin family